MIDEPKIVTLNAKAIAKIHQIVPAEEIQQVVGKTLKELSAAIAEQGITATGPWFTHHLRKPAKTFDFEVCLAVSQKVQASGRVSPGEWPSMMVVRTVYTGGYEGLSQAWGMFTNWIKRHDYTVAEDLWECYLIGPESGKHPPSWQTELNCPLIRRDPISNLGAD